MSPSTTTSVLSERTDRAMRYALVVFGIIAIGSALTVVIAFILECIDPELVTWVVWVRAVFYCVGGVWLLTLVRAARRTAKRSAFVRMRIICILAPLGIAALVIAPDSGYPLWMKIEQALFGALMLPLTIALLRPSVAADFPKPARAVEDPST